MTTKPILIVIAGERAHRYVAGKATGEQAVIDPEANPQELRSNLEYMRLNGLPEETVSEPAYPGEIAFARIVLELSK